MAPSTAQWNPSQILKLGPYSPEASSTCIGHAPSKNRRCRIAIAAANRHEASKLLAKIGSRDITRNVDLTEELEDIAARLLCRRWHQDQACGVVRRWMEKVEDYRMEVERERRWAARAAIEEEEEEVTSVTTTTTTTRNISSTTSSTTTTTSTTTTVQRVVGAARATPSPTVPRTTPVLPTPPSSTPHTRPSPPPQTPSPSTTPAPHTHTEPPPPAPATPSSATPPPPPTPPPDCPICYDPIHQVSPSQRTLPCNHTFHTLCIGTWFGNQDGCARPRNCPCCRREVEGEEGV